VSNWPGKYVIGLTGNIATGKSVVRRMLEHLGAYTIDADALFHRAIARGAPGHQPVLDTFGKWLVNKDGEIDRSKLGNLVFGDREALEQLENIVHPLVKQATSLLIQHAKQPVIVVEANKLLESDVRKACDTIWVTTAPEEIQVERLVRKRGFTKEQALERIRIQGAQSDKVAAANMVIHNTGSYDDLWEQISTEWKKISPGGTGDSLPSIKKTETGEFSVRRGRPRDSAVIAEISTRLSKGQQKMKSEDTINPAKALGALVKEVERASGDLQTEASLLSPSLALSTQKAARKDLGYEPRTPDTTNSTLPNTVSLLSRVPLTELKLIARRIGNAAMTLLVIAYLTSFGLILAERGRERLPANPLDAAAQSFVRVGQFVIDHPQTYYWHKANLPAFSLVLDTLVTSAGLLFISLSLAFIVGIALGITAAVSKSKRLSAFIVLLSTLGVSTPSFLLGMLFWAANIQVHRTFNITVLPSAGFGWDAHLVMPALTLAMRPLAQIAQVTYVSLTDIIQQDYIRTAYSKGLHPRVVYSRHALTNVLIPILTTLGASLRFSLASLPVVEMFFYWPGVGLTLLQAIDIGMPTFVIDLILSLGFFFLLVNMAIEILFPLIDARLRSAADEARTQEHSTFLGALSALYHGLRDWARDLANVFQRRTSELPPLPVSEKRLEKFDEVPSQRRWIMRAIFRNPSLILGVLLVLGLTGLAFSSGQLTDANPYTTNGVLVIEGTIQAPPFKPSSIFPWGSDYVGRDIQALVYHGARQTLSLALFGMLARILLGVVLGTLAGWQRGGWLDRLISGAVGVWAAFPLTLFAMLLIQGLGIQQGMWVFVFTISVVGWGEVAQIVRSQVISIKLQPYIESARSVGSRSDQILIRHVMPNLVNSLIVMAALEMGGVMMLLAELGYLDIFMGGGFRAMIGEVGNAQPLIVHFSDVPEWAALIANVREWWRSYPWMALYPGAAFFISIMAFNLLGEGLRRFLDESQMNLSRLLNRYTFTAGVAVIVAMSLLLQASAPLGIYRSEGLKFDAARVQRDIETLASLSYQGRETGTPGAEFAAQYIAKRMEENGLFPAGEKHTYLQSLISPREHLLDTPALTLIGSDGQPLQQFVYRQDFAEIAGVNRYGETRVSVMGVAFGPEVNETGKPDPYGLLNTAARDKALIIRGADFDKISPVTARGILVIADEKYTLERRDIFPIEATRDAYLRDVPTMVISPSVAEQLLATTGSSLSELTDMAEGLGINQAAVTGEGAEIQMRVNAQLYEDYSKDQYINVIGVIPGEGKYLTSEEQVIMVSAYYDGLGMGPDGAFYPGANDNASGVALLLELARLMQASIYKPEKTVIFVAWAGGERGEGLSLVNVMNARPGAGDFTVEAVIELSGVGYGSGESIALQDGSSYRLVKLFQAAAEKYNDPTTTRGRSPHYGRGMTAGFGDRRALTLSISWDGSDDLAHTPRDVPELIDPQKLTRVGRTTLLTLMVLCREPDY